MHARLHKNVMRVAGQTLGLLLRRGIRLGPMMLLTVRGRLTGQLRTNPVDLFEHEGRQWLVSTHGVGDSNWVRNLRAAGEGTLTRGSHRYAFTAVELSQPDAGIVLRDVVGPRLSRPLAGFVLRRTLRLRREGSADDFARTAEQHPVFEVALTASRVPDPDDVITVERVIPAPADKIFELLADPRRHRMIDGSDRVRDPKNLPPRLSLGAKFDMAMKMDRVPYTMTNEVIEFEEGRRIAWQPRPAARLARSFGGRIWRYELDPVQAGTRMRETWDISQERWVFGGAGGLALGAPGFRFMVKPVAKRTRAAMAATLERIEHLAARENG